MSSHRRVLASALGASALAALGALALGVPVRRAAAQEGARADTATAARLLTTRDGALGAGVGVATAALLPFDRRIATQLQRPGLQHHAVLDHAATAVELLAIPGAFVGSGAAYVVGRLGHHRPLADVGLHVGGSTVFAAAVTEVVKGIAGRARPYVSRDTSPHDFGFGRGLTKGEDYGSFPSGHTTVAFAAASALTSETAHWWPHATRVVAPLAYGGASLVGLARMYHDKHWASDVALGAGVGTLSGLAVVRRQHAHPRNWIDRTFLAAAVSPAPGGLAVVWSVPATPVARGAGPPEHR